MRALALVSLLTACAVEPDSDISPPVDPAPVMPETVIAMPGELALITHFDLDLADLGHDPDALTHSLHAFASAPGATLLAVAAQRDVPELATLRAELPDALEANLAPWIDEAITPLQRLPAIGIEYGVQHALRKFDIASVLVHAGGTVDARTVTPIQHRLVAVDFTPMGYPHRYDLDPADTLLADTTAQTQGASLTIGTHTLSVGVGGFAWDATFAQGDTRAMLGSATNCPLVALAVATRCNGNACVGHVDLLTALCEHALDALVSVGREEAAQLRFAPLALTGATGLDDANRDGVGDGLFGGTWTISVDAGPGPVEITAAFD